MAKIKNKVGVVCNNMEEVHEVINTMYPNDNSKVEDYITGCFFPIIVFDNGNGAWNFMLYKPSVSFNKWNKQYKKCYE